MWILAGEASEEDGEASVARVSGLVEEAGGSVTHSEFWGRRTLAYPIKKNVEGVYYLARFSLEPAALKAVERGMSADQAIIRYLSVAAEGGRVADVTPLNMEAVPPERPRRSFSGRRP